MSGGEGRGRQGEHRLFSSPLLTVTDSRRRLLLKVLHNRYTVTHGGSAADVNPTHEDIGYLF